MVEMNLHRIYHNDLNKHKDLYFQYEELLLEDIQHFLVLFLRNSQVFLEVVLLCDVIEKARQL